MTDKTIDGQTGAQKTGRQRPDGKWGREGAGGDEEVLTAFAVELEQTEWQGRVHALQEGGQVYGLHLTR